MDLVLEEIVIEVPMEALVEGRGKGKGRKKRKEKEVVSRKRKNKGKCCHVPYTRDAREMSAVGDASPGGCEQSTEPSKRGGEQARRRAQARSRAGEEASKRGEEEAMRT